MLSKYVFLLIYNLCGRITHKVNRYHLSIIEYVVQLIFAVRLLMHHALFYT